MLPPCRSRRKICPRRWKMKVTLQTTFLRCRWSVQMEKTWKKYWPTISRFREPSSILSRRTTCWGKVSDILSMEAISTLSKASLPTTSFSATIGRVWCLWPKISNHRSSRKIRSKSWSWSIKRLSTKSRFRSSRVLYKLLKSNWPLRSYPLTPCFSLKQNENWWVATRFIHISTTKAWKTTTLSTHLNWSISRARMTSRVLRICSLCCL